VGILFEIECLPTDLSAEAFAQAGSSAQAGAENVARDIHDQRIELKYKNDNR